MARFSLMLIAGLVPASLLAGCAADGSFPSLAQRPAEKAYAEERDAPDPVVPQPPDDPGAVTRARALVADAEAGRGAFDAAYDAAAPLVGRAGASGSDSWIAAQQAVSRAVAAQAQTTKALADLDQLTASRASGAPISDADAARLREAAARAQAIADAQADRLHRLEAALSRR
jgi:hypothetical protein